MPSAASSNCCRPVSYALSASIFRALGHPTRVMVVATIGKGERCVQQLTDRAGCDISTMSNHLSVLRQAGVLSSERRGSHVFYRVALPCVLDFVGCLVPR
ncbi:MAG: helix-turn-helix transcriptional regulator [Planctomycetes bacterium]|nr:helix-turn-helix transcriptional regulator [Planctomycetota bacterium]